MEWEEAKERPIGHAWDTHDLHRHFAMIWGGFSLPGKRPGFAVAAGLRALHDVTGAWYGQGRDRHGFYEVHVLDECEAADLGDLLRGCVALTTKYRVPGWEFHWTGDADNAAVRKVLAEMDYPFRLHAASLLDIESPYQYMLSAIKEAVREGHKRLFLHGSKATHCLTEIQPEETADLAFGSYPAIEALAFAFTDLRDNGPRAVQSRYRKTKKEQHDPMDWI